MPSIDDIYGSDETLRASHLPPGQSVPVTIERVIPKRFDDGGKLELKFAGKQRVLLANKTNAAAIVRFTGERDYSRWPGKVVWLKAAETEFRGDLVPCVRIDLHPPATTASQLPASPPPTPASEPTYVPDDPTDPGGFRADAASMDGLPGDDIPF